MIKKSLHFLIACECVGAALEFEKNIIDKLKL